MRITVFKLVSQSDVEKLASSWFCDCIYDYIVCIHIFIYTIYLSIHIYVINAVYDTSHLLLPFTTHIYFFCVFLRVKDSKNN